MMLRAALAVLFALCHETLGDECQGQDCAFQVNSLLQGQRTWTDKTVADMAEDAANHRAPHSLLNSAIGAGSHKKQLMDISKVQTAEALEKERIEGVHSDAFETAYNGLAATATLKQTTLDDWLDKNSIQDKQAQRDNKANELSKHRDRSWVVKTVKNWWSDTENTLTGELETLDSDLAAMKLEKAALEAEVQAAVTAINDHKDDAKGILDGLNAQVTAMTTDIASYKANKAADQAQHAKAVANLTAEHLAAVEVENTLIKLQQTQIHEKRDVYYNLTATCAQLETKGTTICKRCDSSSRACGDDCISTDGVCHVVPGCACDDKVGHDLHDDFANVKKALEDTVQLHDLTIKAKTAELARNEEDIKKIEADKLAADTAYEKEKNRLVLFMQSLTSEKTTAENSKLQTEQKLAEKTQASEDAVATLKAALETELAELQASHKQQTESKSTLLAAQATTMKALLDKNAKAIGDWDAKIKNAETEKARLQQEANDFAAALA
jgi:hypothetical protein